MAPQFSDEEQMLLDLVDRFVDEQLLPLEHDIKCDDGVLVRKQAKAAAAKAAPASGSGASGSKGGAAGSGKEKGSKEVKHYEYGGLKRRKQRFHGIQE